MPMSARSVASSRSVSEVEVGVCAFRLMLLAL